MKILYVESKKKQTEPNLSLLKDLPKTIYIAYSIQYKNLAIKLRKALSKNHIIKGFSQVLGCSKLKIKDPILLISDGSFHAINLGLQNNTPIYIYNNEKLVLLDQKQIESIKAKKKAALSRFLSSNKIGILISNKKGQDNSIQAIELSKKLEKKGKKVYLFFGNNINTNELENFKISSWINTACPGISLNHPRIINLEDLKNLEII